MPRDDAIPFCQQCYIDGAWCDVEGVEYGIVGINTGIISTAVAPFGGMKESGIGREGSHIGIDEFL